jgi:2-amino-4-hydroxy-6-hydroxymethyldihydropteridine diphosphokinase
MTNIYLHLGSNVGDRKENLQKAVQLIGKKIGKIVMKSGLYETEAWGKKDQDAFINQAIEINTDLSPRDILLKCNGIEQELGSIKTEKWGPRILDIDILFCGKKKVKEKDLIIPHPEIENRNFVLIPLMEIAGDFVHPVLGKTIEEIYDECNDTCEVYQID